MADTQILKTSRRSPLENFMSSTSKVSVEKFVGRRDTATSVQDFVRGGIVSTTTSFVEGTKVPKTFIPAKSTFMIEPSTSTDADAAVSSSSTLATPVHSLLNVTDEVSEILTSDQTQDSKISSLRSLTERLGISTGTFSEWIWGYSKPVLMVCAYTVLIAVASYASYAFLFGGSWLIFLETLKHVGVTAVPTAITKALGSAGVKLVSNLSVEALINHANSNPKLKKILSQKVPTSYAKNILEKFGVDTENLKYEDITKTVLSSSMNLGYYTATGNLAGYFLSAGLGAGMRATSSVFTHVHRKIIGTKAEKYITTASQNVINSVANEATRASTHTRTSVQQFTVNTIEENTVSTHNERERASSEQTHEPPPKTEISKKFLVVVNDNKILTASTAIATGLVAVALSGNADGLIESMNHSIGTYGPEALSKFGEIAVSLTNIAKESAIAKNILVNVIVRKVGVDKFITGFTDTLNPQDVSKLKSSDPNTFQKILAKIVGDKIYSRKELRTLKEKELLGILKKLSPVSVPEGANRQQLRKTIFLLQGERMRRLTGIVSNVVRETLTTAAVSLTVEVVDTTYAYASMRMEELDLELAKVEEARAIQQGLREREASLKEASLKAETERLERRAAAKAASSVARERHLHRKAQSQTLKAIKHTAALERLELRTAQRELIKSALAEKLARDMDVVITNPETGVSHPLPPENLILNEEIQNALEWNFTPLMQYVTKETAKATTSWIPGVGWAQAAINKANIALTTAETTKNIGKIVEVITRLEAGDTSVKADELVLGKLDDVLSFRVPSLTDAVENLIKTDTLNAKEVVLRALKDKIINGWDFKRTAYEIGQKFLVGTGEDFGVNIPTEIGEKVWGSLKF